MSTVLKSPRISTQEADSKFKASLDYLPKLVTFKGKPLSPMMEGRRGEGKGTEGRGRENDQIYLNKLCWAVIYIQ